MERLTTPKTEHNREMICRYEDCDVCEEYCPHLQEDNCHCLQEVIEKLGQYEDAEEQGLLLRLPCKVGDTVYAIPSWANYRLNKSFGKMELNRVYPQIVDHIEYNSYGYLISTNNGMTVYRQEVFNETWFLTQEVAEQALAEMQGK